MDKRTLKQGLIKISSNEDDLGYCIEQFLFSRKAMNAARGTLHFYRRKLLPFCDFCNAQVVNKVPEISPDLIRIWLIHLEESGHNPGGIHGYYRALKTFLNWWEEETEPEGWKNPIRKVKAPRVPIEPITPVSLETIQALADTCSGESFTDSRDKALIFFLLDSGVRAAECLGVDLDDINLITGAVLIRQGKGRKPRNVFLGKKARKAIRAYIKHRSDNNPALWVGIRADRLQYQGLREIIRRRSIRANVKEPGIHDFRRAFALNMLRNGADVISISRLMGHSSLQVLTRYLKQLDNDLQAAHDRYSPMDNSSL